MAINITPSGQRSVLWDAVLSLLFDDDRQAVPSKLLEQYLKGLAGESGQTYTTVITHFEKAVRKSLEAGTTFESRLPELVQQLRSVPGEKPFADKKDERADSRTAKQAKQSSGKISFTERSTHSPEGASADAKLPPAFPDTKNEEAATDQEAVKEMYLGNAGLVILWPYLQTFFQEVKLMEEAAFSDQPATYKAAHLLQYLASGEKMPEPEYQLTLNKMLCGLEIGEPMERQVDIAAEETIACDELLTAVIRNWAILKNTSVEGLRQSFLMREGKLIRLEGGWQLKVAQKSYDILLEKLSWSIQLIKLPWMPEPIYVEW